MAQPPTTQGTFTPRKGLGLVVAILIFGQLIGALNATLVTAAIPAIIEDLGATAVLGTWLMTIASIAMTVAAPIWGRVSDQTNPAMLLRISLVALLVAATLAATAQDPIVLLGARVLWSIALIGVQATTMILFALFVSPRARGKYMGWISAVSMLGQMGGPLIGGLIVESALGWRGVFAVAAPVGIIILVLLQFVGKVERESPVEKSRIDFLGGGLLAAGLAAVLVYVSFSGSVFEAGDAFAIALLVGGILALVVALVVELRHESPILPIRALRGRTVILVSIAMFGVGLTAIPVAVFLTMYLQSGRGLSPTMSGLMVAAIAIGSVLSSFVVGHLSTRTGRLRRFLIVGGALLVVATAGLTLIKADTELEWIIAILFVLGLGQGSVQQFTVLAAQNAVPVQQVGAMTGWMHFLMSLGGAILLAAFGKVLQVQLDAAAEQGVDPSVAYATSIPQFFVVNLVAIVAALVAFLLLPSIRLRSTIDKTDDEPTEVEESVVDELREAVEKPADAAVPEAQEASGEASEPR